VQPTPTGRLVRLVDVTPETVDRLEELDRHRRGGFNDFGIDGLHLPDDAFATGVLRNEGKGVLFVERLSDGEIVGSVEYHTVSYGPGDASKAWMLGIELTPSARGQGLGTEAQRLLADWLFATTNANRVEASTDVENVAEARALEKAGFSREGINRGAQFRAGAYHDLVLFSRLRSDPP
jgi:RimJ/RimL family protein N-acetyltransferase